MEKRKPFFITMKARKLANKLHKEEHLIINKKIDEDHRLSDWYYLMASGIFQNLFDKIDSDNIEIFNRTIDLEKAIDSLKDSMKEVSKQQKYLWQTLNEKKDALPKQTEGGKR